MTRDRRRPIAAFVEKYLDAEDILGELLFGLIMVLAFTLGAGLIVEEGKDATSQMLLGILGCNVAWGLIDGGMYIINALYERSYKARLLRSIQKVDSEERGINMVASVLDPRLKSLTTDQERASLYGTILSKLKNVAPERTAITRDDLYGAIATFWLVFFAAIPAVLPFLFVADRFVALRVSNALLLIMLFLVGFHLGRSLQSNPWVLGAAVVFVGLLMVAIVVALGG